MAEVKPKEKPKAEPAPKDCNAVKSYDWDTRTAYAICMAESRGDPNRNNKGLNKDGSVDYGLMQINDIHAYLVGGDVTKFYDPAINLRVAYQLYKERGNFTAWSAYNNRSYLSFL